MLLAVRRSRITSGYARQFGFANSIPTCPTFLLRGDARDVSAWKSVRGMADAHRAVAELAAGR